MPVRIRTLAQLLSALLMAGPGGAQATQARPNLVLILADDCTYREIGCYGGQAETPHIDRLAAEGIRLTQCFQAAPMCSPTRHCLYTGLYPVKSGAYPNHTFVKEGVRSLPHYLAPLGYRVALSGKRHIHPPEAFPFAYSGANNPDLAAIDALFRDGAADGVPFCLVACSNEPHTPYTQGDPSRYPPGEVVLPPGFVDTPATRAAFSRYLAEITYFDGQVGEILGRLDAQGLRENTLVMVLSEQGSSFPFAKWTLYDDGVQSILVARWPGRIAAGGASDALVEYVDVVPTFVEAAGGAAPAGLDGRSFLPVLEGKTDRHKAYVFGIQTTRGIYNGPDHFARRSVRSATHKLIRNLDPEARFQNTAVNQAWFREWEARAAGGDAHARAALARFHTPPAVELFDVRVDPWEQINRADDPALRPIRERLEAELDAWMAAQGDQGMPTELAAFDRMLAGNDDARAAIRARREAAAAASKKEGDAP